MSRMAKDGRTTRGLILDVHGKSPSASRADARMRRTQKNKTPILAVILGGRSVSDVRQRHHQAFDGARDSGQLEPEVVESLVDYMPRVMTHEVSLTFSGQAWAVMGKLMTSLDVDTANEVVKRAIPLLIWAQEKEILLRDPRTGMVEIVET